MVPYSLYMKFLFNTLFFLFFFSSCISYKHPPENVIYEDHWLYQVIPRHRAQIQWYDLPHWTTWMLFGNDDDGIFGEKARYKPEIPPSFKKTLYWNCRNPLHNFCNYVIGSAHRTNSELTLLKIYPTKLEAFKYKPIGDTVFASKDTSFFLALHGGKPFVSLRIAYGQGCTSDFYFGWRCRGDFGIKCILYHKPKVSLSQCK